jgi:signal transduction histidine kinase
MKISQKLILGFVAIAMLAGVIGTIGIIHNKNSQSITEREVYGSISHLDDVWQLMEAQEHQEIAANNYLFLDVGLKERRADYFYEKERLEEILQKYSRRACEHAKPWIEKYRNNMNTYHTKIEAAFELHRQGADLELIKERVREADKYVEIAHEDALEPLIEHVHEEHIKPAKESIARGISRTTSVTIIISAVAVFLAIGLGLFTSHSIYVPLAKLGSAAAEIGKGKLDTKIEIVSNDEIGQLADSFRKMTNDLKKTTTSINNLNAANQQLQASEQHLKAANQQLQSEMDERKRAEKALEVSNRDLAVAVSKLQETNRELEDFVYIASHDLHEPLRKISAFGELLKESLGDKLQEDERENLDFMIDGADRMTQMIEGLLTYSRLNAEKASFGAVDLNEIIQQLQQLELATMLEETNGAIEVPRSLPRVKADSVQMRQLLQNLIANGINYRRQGTPPQIVITAKRLNNDKVRIEVSDNGIGIKEEFHEDVFKMFKRLQSRRKYEGAGIGLAVCKKIVDNHGGRIGVESKEGEGSTFWFILSAAKEPVAVS